MRPWTARRAQEGSRQRDTRCKGLEAAGLVCDEDVGARRRPAWPGQGRAGRELAGSRGQRSGCSRGHVVQSRHFTTAAGNVQAACKTLNGWMYGWGSGRAGRNHLSQVSSQELPRPGTVDQERKVTQASTGGAFCRQGAAVSPRGHGAEQILVVLMGTTGIQFWQSQDCQEARRAPAGGEGPAGTRRARTGHAPFHSASSEARGGQDAAGAAHAQSSGQDCPPVLRSPAVELRCYQWSAQVQRLEREAEAPPSLRLPVKSRRLGPREDPSQALPPPQPADGASKADRRSPHSQQTEPPQPADGAPHSRQTEPPQPADGAPTAGRRSPPQPADGAPTAGRRSPPQPADGAPHSRQTGPGHCTQRHFFFPRPRTEITHLKALGVFSFFQWQIFRGNTTEIATPKPN
ncbi:protein piccolo-like [Pongo pygmaeus]|uniref:protein piccolo-like n=1 Tax=Pongo pygmaeus TaxID=9600 RepID=UPI00300D7C68